MKKIIKYIILIMLPFIFITGLSSWVITGEKSFVVGQAVVAKEVAYLSTDPSKKYTRIEKALEVANAQSSAVTVYVIVGSNPTIIKDCVIESHVTLCLPYNGTTYANRAGNKVMFADDPSNTENNKVLEITIDSGVTLTNKGNLQIGGILGCEYKTTSSGSKTANQLQGHTSDDYAQITMKSNSKIISTGTIECYGYIKESNENNGSKVIANSGEIYSPFVIYDFRGGSNTVGVYMATDDGAPIIPFNVFDMPNIQVEQNILSGAKIYGLVDIYTNEQSKGPYNLSKVFGSYTISIGARHNIDIINIVGPDNDNLIILKKGYLKIKYNPKQLGYTSQASDGGYTNLDFYGEASFGYFSIVLDIMSDISVTKSGGIINMSSTIKNVIERVLPSTSVTTDNIYFPICYKYNINLHFDSLYGGNYSISKKVKFMTGSKLQVNKNATLNFESGASVIFYSAFNDKEFNSIAYPSKNFAYLNDNGIVNINNGSAVAGIIKTESVNSTININSGSTLSLTSFEGTGSFAIEASKLTSGDPITYDFTPVSTHPNGITETLRGYTSSSTAVDNYINLTSSSYTSVISTKIIGVNYIWQ